MTTQLGQYIKKTGSILVVTILLTSLKLSTAYAATPVTSAGGSDGAGTSDLKPAVSINETVAWTNQTVGEAEVTINVDETPEKTSHTSRAGDIVLALDRSASMVVNSYYYQKGATNYGFSKTSNINSGNSPCLNDDHYYQYGSKKITSVISNSLAKYDGHWINTTVASGFGEVKLWDLHYNEKGKKIQPSHVNGCKDKFSLSKEVLEEQINAYVTEINEGKSDMLNSRLHYLAFSDGMTTIDGNTKTSTGGNVVLNKNGSNRYATVRLAEFDSTSQTTMKNLIARTNIYPGSTYAPMFNTVYKIASDSGSTYPTLKLILLGDGAVADPDDANTAWKKIKNNLSKGRMVAVIAMGLYDGSGLSADGTYGELNQKSVANEITELNSSKARLSKYAFLSGSSEEPLFLISSSDKFNAMNEDIKRTLTNLRLKGFTTTAYYVTEAKTISIPLKTDYWDFTIVSSKTAGSTNYSGNTLTWIVPAYTDTSHKTKTYQMKFKIKLNDGGKYVSENGELKNLTNAVISMSYQTALETITGYEGGVGVAIRSDKILSLPWDTSPITVKEATTTPNGIVLSGISAANYYKPSDSANRYYIKSDTDFSLSFTGYTRYPTASYQVNENIYQVYNTVGSAAQQITLGSFNETNTLTTNTYSNTEYLQKVSAQASRLSESLNGAARKTGYQTTLTTKMLEDKQEVSVYAVSRAYIGGHGSSQVNSSATNGTSYTNTKIELIADGKAPVINPPNSLSDTQTITSTRDYLFTASDDGSGMNSLIAMYYNKSAQKWEVIGSGIGSMSFTVDFSNKNMLGDVEYRVVATDKVGNTTTKTYYIFASNIILSQTTITGNEDFTSIAPLADRDKAQGQTNGNIYYVNEGSRFTLTSKSSNVYADNDYHTFLVSMYLKNLENLEKEGITLSPISVSSGNVETEGDYYEYNQIKVINPFSFLTPLTSTWVYSANLTTSTANFMGTAEGDGIPYVVYPSGLMNSPYENKDYTQTEETYLANDRINKTDIHSKETDLEKSITIIPDGTAPQVNIDNSITNGSNKVINEPTTISVGATDPLGAGGYGSGIASLKITAYNEQQDVARTLCDISEEKAASDDMTILTLYSLNYWIYVDCPYEDNIGDEFWLGDIDITIQTTDRVGNAGEFTFKLTVFTLEASIERVYPDDTRTDNSFLIGEAGWVRIKTGGYVDTVEVEFPDGFSAVIYNPDSNINNDLNQPVANDDENNEYYYYLDRTFESDYGAHYRNPVLRDFFSHGFIVPQYYDDDTYGRVLTVKVRAWKGEEYVEKEPYLYITDPTKGESTDLNELLGRLRTRVLN